MAVINLTNSFQICPEGVDIFMVSDVTYDEDFGKMEITLTNADGFTIKERYNLMMADGNPNEKALSAFSFFAKTALNNFKAKEVDPIELVGHFIEGNVVHTTTQSKTDADKTVTFANLKDRKPATGFNRDSSVNKVDIDDILGI